MTNQTDKPLTGKHALVIGGGSGIGLGSAQLLAGDGATVTLAGRTESKLSDAASTLRDAHGIEVDWVVCDALSGTSVKAAVDHAADDDRGLHIAVVVPGGGSIVPVLCYEDDQFSAEVDLNVRPVYLTLKYAGRAMIRAGGGSFIAISSTAAVFSSPNLAAYCAGKAAVDHLVRVAADELGAHGVRVNSVQPGLTRTPTTERTFENPRMLDAFLAEQPIARGGEVPDVAAAVRYFAGPESSWTTGQALTIDGGHTLRKFVDFGVALPLPDQRQIALDES